MEGLLGEVSSSRPWVWGIRVVGTCSACRACKGSGHISRTLDCVADLPGQHDKQEAIPIPEMRGE